MNDQSIERARRRRSAWGTVGLAAALLVRGVPSHATTVLRMDVGQQVVGAELIVRGELVRTETTVSADGRRPYTLATFHVLEVFKGDTDSGELTLRLLGGETDEDVVVVHGMPSFDRGDKVVLFVQHNGEVFCPILGWGQGKLRVLRDPRSDEEILVNETGEPLRGIENGRWVKDAAREELRAKAHGDLNVVDPGPGPAPSTHRADAAPATRAETVLQALRGLVQERAGKSSYRAGRRVASVDPREVPPNVGGSAESNENRTNPGRTGR